MWLWECELRELGFRRKGERYWQCIRRWGLRSDDHLSLWSWSEQTIPSRRQVRYLVELTEFHVTFEINCDNVHFYYHECAENDWQPGGHTSSGELVRLGCDAVALRDKADQIALRLVAALRGTMHARGN